MKLNKKAFTLVEMLIVVVIIGILAAALLPKLMSAQGRARDTARKADLNQIMTATKVYYGDEWAYPSYDNTAGCVWSGTNGFIEAMGSYMSEIPTDPQKNRVITIDGSNNCKWIYAYSPIKSSGTDDGAWVLVANLEIFGKAMNWVLVGTDWDTSYLSGTALPNILDLKNLVKNKCKDGVFQEADPKTCGWATTKGNAEDDWEGVYVVFLN